MSKVLEISARRQKQKGVVILLWTITLPTLISMMGLGVDASILYAVRTRLQLAADGSALAAARGLSLGLTTEEQVTNATAQAATWFRKNYGNGYFGSYNLQDPDVTVYEDPNNPRIRNVDVVAQATAPAYFMNFWGYTGTPIGTLSRASRRDVVMMLVLDRSGSMTSNSGCTKMKTSAKLFNSNFQAVRDRIGMVTYSDTYYMVSAPSGNFKTILGDASTAGAIDNISCSGWTGIPQAVSIAYNELYKTALPGALNAMVFMTDGLPNTLTLSYVDKAAGTSMLRSSSNCKDSTGRDRSSGSFNFVLNSPNWHAAVNYGSGSWLPNLAAGPVGGTSYTEGAKEFIAVAGNMNNSAIYSSSVARGCAFPSSWDLSDDMARFPRYDIYGNDLQFPGYRTASSNGAGVETWDVEDAAFNASASAAKTVRTDRALPSGTNFPGVTIYAIGLGGTTGAPADHELMRRMSNAPNDSANTAGYGAWSGHIHGEPTGFYFYANNPDELGPAFQGVASMILRLSQ